MMRTAALLAAMLLAPAVALAQSRPAVALRLGGGVPFGRTAGAASLSEEVRFALPLTAELTFAASPRVAVGPFVQYAVAAMSRDAPLGSGACTDTASACSDGHVVRLGVQVLWRLGVAGGDKLWAGAGAAYEWLGYSARDPSGSGTIRYRGWEASAQLGADVLRRGASRFGPYASAHVGRFGSVRVASGGESFTGEIANKTLHGWLEVGLRAALDL
jgi:hypothetical protein